MGKNATPRPSDNAFDLTNKIRDLTFAEKKEGWEIVVCSRCGAGAYRVARTCGLCKGAGRIRVLNPEKSPDRETPRNDRRRAGRPRKR